MLIFRGRERKGGRGIVVKIFVFYWAEFVGHWIANWNVIFLSLFNALV